MPPMVPADPANPVIDPACFYAADGLGKNPESSVGLLVKRVGQSIVMTADRRLAAHGLTHAQWVPLMKLHLGQCGTVAGLARELQTDAGAMTRALDRLEAKGLVRRARSQDDRRVVKLALTDEGQRLASLVPPVLAEVLNDHLAGFSHAEWQQLVGLLQRVIANGEALRAATPDAGRPGADDDLNAETLRD